MATVREKPAGPSRRPRWTVAMPPDGDLVVDRVAIDDQAGPRRTERSRAEAPVIQWKGYASAAPPDQPVRKSQECTAVRERACARVVSQPRRAFAARVRKLLFS